MLDSAAPNGAGSFGQSGLIGNTVKAKIGKPISALNESADAVLWRCFVGLAYELLDDASGLAAALDFAELFDFVEEIGY